MVEYIQKLSTFGFSNLWIEQVLTHPISTYKHFSMSGNAKFLYGTKKRQTTPVILLKMLTQIENS